MKQIKTAAARATMIAALSMAAAAAHAVPIVFDFTGTVTDSTIYTSTGTTSDDSLNGQTVSGRITLETEGLLSDAITGRDGVTIGHTDSLTDALDWINSELFIGEMSYDMSLYPSSGGYILAFDSNGAPPCEGCSGVSEDRLAVRDSTVQQYWDVPYGEYHRRDLMLWWGDALNPLGLVDLSDGFDPLAWLPVLNALLPSGSYTERTLDCIDIGCLTSAESRTNFSISSISVSAVNVPEPGALALFALGLVGAALGRRGLAQ